MYYQPNRYRLLAGFATVILVFASCSPQIQKPERICPGKESAAESLAVLRSHSKNTTPLKASGQCLLQYYTEGNKTKKENFPVKLWVNPPDEIYVQGDVAFDPKGIVLGLNEDEFWLAIKLKEVSSYWWGRWAREDCPERLMINPILVLEALGAMPAEDGRRWSLSNEGAFDVLVERRGIRKAKKMYINNCDYLVRRIEYFDDGGRIAVVVELGGYKEVLNGFFVPTFIKIVNCSDGDGKDSVRITLNSVKSTNFSGKQRERLFNRPRPKGFEHIYKIVDGGIVEQRH